MFRGLALKLGRPANYNPNAVSIAARQAPKLDLRPIGLFSSHVPNGPNKLYIGGLPYNLKQTQVSIPHSHITVMKVCPLR